MTCAFELPLTSSPWQNRLRMRERVMRCAATEKYGAIRWPAGRVNRQIREPTVVRDTESAKVAKTPVQRGFSVRAAYPLPAVCAESGSS